MSRATFIAIALIFPLAACGGSGAASTTDTTDETATTAGGAEQDSLPAGSGVSTGPAEEALLKVCGPRVSYERVSQFQCPDGSTPLGGDWRAGQQARLGSTGSHLPEPPTDPMNSHIVDIYQVPCPSGPVEVRVCMYHCDAQSP